MAWRFVNATARVKASTASPNRPHTYCGWTDLRYVEGVNGDIASPARRNFVTWPGGGPIDRAATHLYPQRPADVTPDLPRRMGSASSYIGHNRHTATENVSTTRPRTLRQLHRTQPKAG